jgi:hypothetical protein
VFQLVAPFQLEVANLWYVMKDFVDEKAFGKLASLFVMNYIMNKGAERLRGSGVTLDPIQAMVDAIVAYRDSKDTTTGVLKAGGRLSGEVFGNVPGGQTIAGMYPELGATVAGKKLPTRKDLFGEGDPTRFGSGLLATKAITDPAYMTLPPFGGAQLKRTIEGVSTVAGGQAESKAGKVQFPVAHTLRNLIQAGIFGKYSLPEARAYFDSKASVLGDKQTKFFNDLPKDKAKEYYDAVLALRASGGKVSGTSATAEDAYKNVIQAKNKADFLKTPDPYAKIGDAYYVRKVSDTGTVTADVIPLQKDLVMPSLTANANLNKKLMSKYKGEITRRTNDVVALYEAGAITYDQAAKELDALKGLATKAKARGSRSKKGKKIAFAKVTAPKIGRINIRISVPKMKLSKTRRGLVVLKNLQSGGDKRIKV